MNKSAIEKSEITSTSGSGEADFDLVLVDAPQATIASCLAALQKDAENYVGLEVDEQEVAAQDRANGRDANGSVDKKLASDWTQYSRGPVSQKQKASLNDHFYYRGAVGGERSKVIADGKERFDAPTEREGKPPVKEAKQARQEKEGAAVAGRARRLLIVAPEQRKLERLTDRGDVADATVTAGTLSIRRAQSELKTADGVAPTDNVQVLFVIAPNHEPAVSPTTKKARKITRKNLKDLASAATPNLPPIPA